MKKSFFLVMVSILFVFYQTLYAENINLVFKETNSRVIDSIKITNITKGSSLTIQGQEPLILNVVTVGLNPIRETDKALAVLPNPSKEGNFVIEAKNLSSAQTSLFVHDMSGRLVLQRTINSFGKNLKIRISSLKAGVYTLSFYNGGKRHFAKLLSYGQNQQNPKIEIIENFETNSKNITPNRVKYISNANEMNFSKGDKLLFKFYSGNFCSILSDSPQNSKEISFEIVECKDYDNNFYPVVKIGEQYWMAENLKTAHYQDGSEIPSISDNGVWASLSIGALSSFQNNGENSNHFGYLYNWHAVSDNRKISPKGWRIPTNDDWQELTDFLGGRNYAGGKLKLVGETLWNAPNLNATNEVGFSAVGASRRLADGSFGQPKNEAFFWSTTEVGQNSAYQKKLSSSSNEFQLSISLKNEGLSVRCIWDEKPNIEFPHITEAGLDVALAELDKTQMLEQIISAQFALRGGKQGYPPGPHAYQWQFNLHTDNYAGYLCLPQNFDGRMPSTYYNCKDFNGGVMSGYSMVKAFLAPLLNHPQIDSIPELKAMALLIFNVAAHEAADAYGPIPYKDYKVNKQSHPFVYNAVDSIYTAIVHDIDTIVACFKNFESRPDWYKTKVGKRLINYDKLSSNPGNPTGWIRYANSLKLKLALQSVKANPLAKKWAERAVADGVIETAEQQFGLRPKQIGFSHPLFDIANYWNDTRLNASLETILKQYNHPMLGFVFKRNSHSIINKNDAGKVVAPASMYVGLRSGIRMLSGQGYDNNFRVAYSTISKTIYNMPLFVMKVSEVNFLRAEGALRGWNMGGSAESFYYQGIDAAFSGSCLELTDETTDWETLDFDKNVYKPYLEEYKKIETAQNIKYIDPYSDEYNIESLVKVGVKWNESDNNETKLEKIMTQKYISGFPNSFGAWADLRRTGYPRIFPVVFDDGDGSIVPGDIIRRIPYPGVDQEAVRKDIEATALKSLGGLGDKQGTRIWWDVATPNF